MGQSTRLSIVALACPRAIALALGAITTVLLNAGPASAQIDPRTREGIEAAAVEHMAKTGVAGLSIAIVRDGQLVHVAGFGSSGTGGVTPDTPLRIASLTKSITALGVVKLVEQGRLRLDAPVAHYLPEFQLADARFRSITVRHVLNHASGLNDQVFPEMRSGPAQTLRQAVARIKVDSLAVDPGTEWFYHNPNYHIAARLIEVGSGEPYETYVRRSIFEPLGMSSSFSVDCGQEPASVAQGHVLLLGRAVALPEPDYFCTGSGSVVSTARDMGKWLAFHQSSAESQLINSASKRLLHTPPAPPMLNYAMGWYNQRGAGGGPVRLSHSGVTGTFSAYQGIFPTSGLGVVVLQNTASPWADAYSLADNITRVVEGRVPEASRTGTFVDLTFLSLLAATLIATGWAVVTSRSWAKRELQRHLWHRTLSFGLLMAGGVICANLPTIASKVVGRDGTWLVALYLLPSLALLIATVGACCFVLLSVRVFRLVRLHKSVASGAS